jgi:hypothetical protein
MRVCERSTWELFTCVQGVWSPNGPPRIPAYSPASLILAAHLVTVLESVVPEGHRKSY